MSTDRVAKSITRRRTEPKSGPEAPARRKFSVFLLSSQLAELDAYQVRFRDKVGGHVDRSEITRALFDLFLEDPTLADTVASRILSSREA